MYSKQIIQVFSENKNDIMKLLCRVFLCLVISVLVGTGMLVATYSIPGNIFTEHLRQSVTILQKEEGDANLLGSGWGARQDNTTEAVYLGQAAYSDKEEIVKSALSGYLYSDCGQPLSDLNDYLNDRYEGTITEFPKWWNGWVVVVKLFLVICDYGKIRGFNYIIQPGLFLICLELLRRRNMIDLFIPFSLSYLMISPVTVSLCMTLSGYYFCTIIPVIIILLFHERLCNNYRYILLFESIGIWTFYFNMNYNQLLSWGIPAIIFMFLNNSFRNTRKFFFDCCLTFIPWGIGYVGMMLSKWILYGALYGFDVMARIIENAAIRMSSDAYGATITRLEPVIINYKAAMGNKVWLMCEAVFLLYIIYKLIKAHIWLSAVDILAIAVFVFMPVARFSLLANHSYIHVFTMYRNIAMSVLAINGILAMKLSTVQKKQQ